MSTSADETKMIRVPNNEWWDALCPTEEAAAAQHALVEARKMRLYAECERLYKLTKELGVTNTPRRKSLIDTLL